MEKNRIYIQPPDILYNTASNTNPRAMNFGEFRNGKAQQPLPPSLAPHEAEIDRFASLCNQACAQILNLLALGLGVFALSLSSILDISLTNSPDRPQLLHHPSRPKQRRHRLDPAVPVLPVDLLVRNIKLQARRRRASRCTLRLREHHASLPAAWAAGT